MPSQKTTPGSWYTCSLTDSVARRRLVRCAAVVALLLAAAVVPIQAQTGVYTLNGGTASLTGQTYAATLTDQSAIYVLSSGHLTLTNCTMTKTGDSSNVNTSSQYGTNAGVLAKSAGTVTIVGGSVTTNASGANGLFATGSGSSVTMSDGTISASGSGAHGVDATYTGSITLTNVNVTSTGASSSALATDFGGGTVTVTGGTIIAAATADNSHSAGIYSTGTISVTNATVSSVADCGGVIDGANSILLTNTALTGKVEGIKIWKTAPASGTATVTINGGSLTATAGDGFYVTGETGNAATAALTVSGGATVSASTGNLVNVKSSSTATFTAKAVALAGNLVADSTSTITASLQNSTTLTGTAARTAMTVDSTSAWYGLAGSTLTSLSNSGTVASSADAPGLLTITGSFTQAATGVLDIQLGSASSYDHLAVTGAANLGGTLNVDLVDDFVPTVGTTFDIITRGSGSGTFSSTTTSDSGLTYSVEYGSTYVRITITAIPELTGACCLDGVCSIQAPTDCAAAGGVHQGTGTICESTTCLYPGDVNCDGVTSYADINPFVLAISDQTGYETQYPDCNWLNADCNADGVVSYADINAFVQLLGGI